MYGAILGDIIGSPYEFDVNNIKTTEFELFSDRSMYTDDSIMTCAVAEGLMNCGIDADEETMSRSLIQAMKKYGKRYPFAGYGVNFSMWLQEEDPKPYQSFGNGSAMRVSPAVWLCQENLQQMLHIAAVTAAVSHNHPEGIRGAQATAAVIFMGLHGSSKEEIKNMVTKAFGYDLSRTCDEIRPDYHHVESCQETVPQAICAFMEGDSFESVIRLAVSLGGDSDTLAAIAGSMAEAFYGVPEDLKQEARKRLPDDLREVKGRGRQKGEGERSGQDGSLPKRASSRSAEENRSGQKTGFFKQRRIGKKTGRSSRHPYERDACQVLRGAEHSDVQWRQSFGTGEAYGARNSQRRDRESASDENGGDQRRKQLAGCLHEPGYVQGRRLS